MKTLKRLYWRIYYRLFGIEVADEAPTVLAGDGTPRMSRAAWEAMIARDYPNPAGTLDAYTCGKRSHIIVTIQLQAGQPYYRVLCPRCPRLRAVGKMAFPAAPSYAISANACGGKGVDKLTPEMVTYEHYRPPYPVYLAIANAATRAHLEGGGLLLRPASRGFAKVD